MSDMENEDNKKGTFDRGLNFSSIKKKLIDKAKYLYKTYNKAEKPLYMRQLIYCIISMISLRNGSRISESIKAFKKFLESSDKNDVEVKISKSDATKIIKKNGQKSKMKLKARFRDIVFPKQWISSKIFKSVQDSDITNALLQSTRMRKLILDYLLAHFQCNTHSLRYAFINHMLYDKKIEMPLVSKIVGHANVNQLVTYTQQKNAKEKLHIEI